MANEKMTRANAVDMAIEAIKAFEQFSAEDKATAIEKLEKVKAGFTRVSNGEKKPTENQKINEELKGIILKALEGAEKPMSIADVMALDERFGSVPQKATSLLTQLKNVGKVVRVEGRKATYALA